MKKKWIFGFVVINFVFHSSVYALDELTKEECERQASLPGEIDEFHKKLCDEQLEDVPLLVVTPTRREQELMKVPASVSVVTKDEIQKGGPDGIAEALRDVPGIEITDSGQAGLKRIRIRGEESRRVVILIDGQEFADEREVGTPLLIAPEMVERIEVIRGTGSVLYGSRGLGGVVNIITKKGGYHPVQGTVSTLFDSSANGTQNFASVYGKLNDFSYRVAGVVANYGDRESGDGEVDDTSFDNNSAYLYLSKDWDNHTLAFSYDKYNSDSDVYVEPEVATTPPFTDFTIDAPKRDRSKTALFYDGRDLHEAVSKLHVDAYYQESERKFNTFSDLELDFGNGELIPRESDVYNDSTLDTVGGNSQIDFTSIANHAVIAGLQTQRDSMDQHRKREQITSGVRAPDENIYDDAHQTTFELFIQDEWSFVEDWVLTAGARGNFVDTKLEDTTRPGLSPDSTNDQHTIGAASLSYYGIENTTLWTGWSQGYVYPTLINLATGAYAGPDFVNPNFDLDPETSNSVELGARFDDDLFSVDGSLFFSKAKDYIDHVACSVADVSCLTPAGRKDRVYVNIDDAQSFGAEITGKYNFNEMISPYVSAAWIRRRYETETYTTYETGIPDFTSRIGVQVENVLMPNKNGWFDFYVRTATDAKELEETGETDNNPGWATLNFATGVDFGNKNQYQFILDLINLTDKEYINSTENIPAPGRSAIIRFVANI